MKIEDAKPPDLPAVYLKGYDAWGAGLAKNEYLLQCANDTKYKRGRWVALFDDAVPIGTVPLYF